MDFNLVVITGLVAAPAYLPQSSRPGNGRLLVTVRSSVPGPRVDLLPVSLRADQVPPDCVPGAAVWVAGSLQRRFSAASGRSRVEIVAHHVELRDEEMVAPH